MKLYIHEPVLLLFLFSSVPAIGTEFAFGKSDGLHQIVQTMETKGSEIQSLADLLHHLRVILAVGICIILKHLVTWVGSLSRHGICMCGTVTISSAADVGQNWHMIRCSA